MPEKEIILIDAAPETAKEKFERERLSRRQALKRFGMTSAMATFALFSVDDLARMVGKAMQQRAGDNKIAAQLAQEFQKIGVSFATPPGKSPLPGNCYPNATPAQKDSCCDGDSVGNWCRGYGNRQYCEDCCNGVYGNNGWCSGYGGNANSITCHSRCQQDYP